MNQGIKGINLLFDDGDNMYIENTLLSNLYIANIDNEAHEIPYEKLFKTNKLYANFLSLKINHLINDMENANILKKIYNKKNLTEIELNFERKKVSFYISSDIDPFKKTGINTFDRSFFQENDLCLLICPYEIKYKNYLFV